jgi:hypothetical protein
VKLNVRLGALATTLAFLFFVPTLATAQEGGVIAGTVTSGGAPVSGVLVYVFDAGDAQVGAGFTDAVGHYETNPLPPGTYYVTTSNDQHLIDELHNNIPCVSFVPGLTGDCIPSNGQGVSVTNGGTTTVNFDLAPGARIGGVVTNAAGLPLEFATILLYDQTGDFVTAALTNSAGVYVTGGGLLPGTYYAATVSVAGSGYVNEKWDNIACSVFCDPGGGTPIVLGPVENRSNINFSLSSVGSISGTVRAAVSNAPIAGARVDVYDTLGRFVGSATTDGAGSYSIGVGAGTYFVIASAAGYLKEHVITRGTRVDVSSGVTSNANFLLTAGGRISGFVRGDGAPLPNTVIEVYSADGRTLITSTFTDGAGQYITGEGLAPGNYLLRTRNSAGRIDQSRTVTIAGPGTVTGIDFALAGGANLSGTVRDASTSAPLAGVSVLLFDTTGKQLALTAVTDAAGKYMFPAAVPPGTYFAATNNQIGYIDEAFDNVVCAQSKCDVKSTTPIVVGTTPITNINFQLSLGGGISGLVTGVATGIASPGIPLPNVIVEIYADNGLFIGTAITNAAGFYTLQSGLPADKYFVKTVNAAGFVDQVFNGKTCVDCPVNLGDLVTVAVGATTQNINFTLQRGGRISGTIFDVTTGLPLANAPVIIRDVTGATVAIIKTDNAGVYRVSLPAPATYYVQTGGIEGYTTSIYNPAAAPDGARALEGGRWSPTGDWIPAPSDEGACPRGLCDVGAEFAIDLAEGGDKTAINVSVTSSPTAALMSITPTTLPVGTPGALYSQTLTATGGTAPYGYTVTDGALPLGLSLDFNTGLISGTPTTSGFSTFTVAASDFTGVSTSRAYTLTISERPAGPPGAPLNLAASVENFHGHFTWTPGGGGEATSYRLEVGTRPGGTLAAFETPNATPSLDIPVIPPGEYWARVRGRNEFGLGAPLDEYRLFVTATGYSPPGAPVNVVALMAGTALTVTWDADPGGTPATGYMLEAGTAPTLSNVAVLNLGNTRTFSYTGVPPGVYYLRVRAYNVAGASDPSKEVVLNVGNLPAAPGVPNALARAVSGSTVTLSWLLPSDGGAPASYVIEAGTSRGFADIARFDTGSATPQVTVNAVPPGAYWIRVRARNAQGLGSPTADIRLVVP